MKVHTKSHRKINSIAPGRWTAYLAAAAASTFAGVGSAEAEIHYSGDVSIKLKGHARATLPLSNGASLVFQNKDTGSTFWQDFDFVITGAISGSARPVYGSRFVFLANLPAGENVSAGSFSSVAGHPNIGVLISNWSDGQFTPVGESGRGFVGFRFNSGNGTQYGWARISTRDDIINGRHHIRDNIKDYAWGDVGDDISTGQTQSLQPANATSVAGSLGLLAFGAQGVDTWRTQRMPKSN